MADIIIGKAKVIAIEEITLNNPKASTAGTYDVSGSAYYQNSILAQHNAVITAPVESKPKSIIVSKLKVEAAGKTEGFSAIEGIMQLPMQLPFGKVYELTLHDPGTGVLDTNDRMFKEEEHA